MGKFRITTVQKQDNGVLCTMSDGKLLKLEVASQEIIRVVFTIKHTIPEPKSQIVIKDQWPILTWYFSDVINDVTIKISKIKVIVTKSDGRIRFFDLMGNILLEEKVGGRTITPVTLQNQSAYTGTLNFESPSNEGIY